MSKSIFYQNLNKIYFAIEHILKFYKIKYKKKMLGKLSKIEYLTKYLHFVEK